VRGIFGLKRDKIIGGWKKLYKGEFHNLYSSLHAITMISKGGRNGQGA
jgi:hypothetical protein